MNRGMAARENNDSKMTETIRSENRSSFPFQTKDFTFIEKILKSLISR